MKYVIGLPRFLIVEDASKVTRLIGGACPVAGTIYLYGWGGGVDEWEHHIWSGIIRHEHLHDLLHKNEVPIEFHHKIIDLMEPYVYHTSEGTTKMGVEK